MARVELSRTATRNLDRLILTHNLPADTRERLRQRLNPLGRFPLLGPVLTAPWAGYRYVLGPWRWMVVVCEYLEDADIILVVTIVDGRSKSAPTPSD